MTPFLDEQDRPWMKLTAYDGGTGLYAWTEQYYSGSAWVDLPGGAAGTVNGLSGATATILPAVEMNGQVVTTFPWYVRGERAIEDSTVGVYYQFTMGGSAASTLSVVLDSTVGTHTFNSVVSFTLNNITFTSIGWYFISAGFLVTRSNTGGAPVTAGQDVFGMGGCTTGTGSATPSTSYYTPWVGLIATTGVDRIACTGVWMYHVTALSAGTAVAPLTFLPGAASATLTVTVDSVGDPLGVVKVA